MIDVQAETKKILDETANKLAVLNQRAVLEAFPTSPGTNAQLNPPNHSTASNKTTASTVTATAAKKPAASAAKKTTKPAKPASKKGEKRSPEELANLVEKVFDHIKANPGQKTEQIGPVLKLTTKELTLPIKKLIANKRVRTEGEKRATAYFAK